MRSFCDIDFSRESNIIFVLTINHTTQTKRRIQKIMLYKELIVIGVGVIAYILHMRVNKLFRPNTQTFLIWFLVSSAHTLLYRELSPSWGVPIEMLALSIVVALIAVRRKQKRRTYSKIKDTPVYLIIALVVSALSLLCKYVWSVDPITSSLCAQIPIYIGFAPLLVSLDIDKMEEPLIPWALFAIGYAIMLFNTYVANPIPQHQPLAAYRSIVILAYPAISLIGCTFILGISLKNKFNR